jgi:hypothetical protein
MAIAGGKLYFVNETGIFYLKGDSAAMLHSFNTPGKYSIQYDMKEIEPGVLAIANCNSLQRYNIKTGKLDTIFNAGQYCVRTIWKYKDYLFFGTYGGGLYISKNGIVKAITS